MPALPEVLARPRGGLVEMPRVQGGNAIAAGLADVAQGFNRAAADLRQYEEQDARLWTAKTGIGIRTRLLKQFQEKQLSGEPLDGLTAWMETATDAAFSEASKDAPNEMARQLFAMEGLETKARFSADAMKSESEYKVKSRLADLQETLNGFKASAALDPANAPKYAAQWEALVATTPMPIEFREDMKRGGNEIVATGIQTRIERSPGATLAEIDAALRANMIDADTAVRLRERAQNEIDRAEARAAAAAARADREAEKQMRVARDEFAKDAYERIAAGTLTEDWIETNRSNLSPEDYRIALAALDNPTDQRDFEADMLRRIYVEGDDAREDIIRGVETGVLSPDKARTLLNETQGVLEDRGVQPAMETARNYIKTQIDAIGRSTDDPALGAAIMGEAMLDLEEWRRQNPDATDADIIEQSKLIVRRRSISDYRRIAEQLTRPAFLSGTVAAPDFERTIEATNEFFMRKHGGNMDAVEADPEFQREALAIEKLRATYEASKAASEAK